MVDLAPGAAHSALAVETHPSARRAWRDELASLAERFFSPPTTMQVGPWLEANRVLSTAQADASGRYQLSEVPYLVGILEALSDPLVQEIVILKAARLGVTEAVINGFIGYVIDQDPGPILVVWPTKDDAADWSKEVLPDLFETTQCLKGKVAEAGSRDSDNTILHKRFSGGFLYAVGANSPRTLRRKNARYIQIDEYDACVSASGGPEGDVGARAKKRADTFENRKVIISGSPALLKTGSDGKPTAGSSPTWRDFLKSDQRHFYVECPHCRHRQVLLFENLRWDKEHDERGVVTRHLPDTAHFVCTSGNGCVITEDAKRDMLAEAAARPDRGWTAHAPPAPGEKKPAGFALNSFLSLFDGAKWRNLVREWLDAQGDRSQIQVFVNTRLGLPYEDRDVVIDGTKLGGRREPYAAQVPMGVGLLTAAVDVQGDRLELLVIGWGAHQECWLIEHHRIYGDPSEHGAGSVWERLDALLFRTYQHEGGAPLHVLAAAVDTGDQTDDAYHYVVPRQRRGVFAVKGEHRKRARPMLTRAGKAKNSRVHLHMVDADKAKDTVFLRLALMKPGPGFVHIPHAQDHGLGDDFLEQFGNEKPVWRKQPDGSPVRFYQKVGPNEAVDLFAYNYAALYLLGAGVMQELPQIVARVQTEGRLRGGPTAAAAGVRGHATPGAAGTAGAAAGSGGHAGEPPRRFSRGVV